MNKIYNESILEELMSLDDIPEANLKLADPSMVDFWKDYSERIIHLDGDINYDTMKYVDALYRWNREDDEANIPIEDRRPVLMYICSWGGDLYACYAMIAAMEAYKGKIITVNMAVACSAAALIFISGTPGFRFCTKYSYTLIHQGSSSGGCGTYAQQEEAQKNYQKLIKMMENMVLSKTNITPKVYKKIQSKENYYYPEDCIEMGICDAIIESISDIWNSTPTPSVLIKEEIEKAKK